MPVRQPPMLVRQPPIPVSQPPIPVSQPPMPVRFLGGPPRRICLPFLIFGGREWRRKFSRDYNPQFLVINYFKNG